MSPAKMFPANMDVTIQSRLPIALAVDALPRINIAVIQRDSGKNAELAVIGRNLVV